MAYDRDFKGIWIPKEVWLSDALSMQEKLFYVEIDSLDNDNGCFASNAHFASFFDISKGRCTQIIKSLEAKKLITINLEYKGKQVVRRLIRVVNKLNTPLSNLKHPYLENAEDNNTSINNTVNNTKEVTTSKNSEDSIRLALYLYKNITKINPSFRQPNINNWAKDIDLAIRIDGRTMDQLKDCIDWIYSKQGEFWQKNILSGKKLRDKFDTMNMQVITKKPTKKEEKLSKLAQNTVNVMRKRGHTEEEIEEELRKMV